GIEVARRPPIYKVAEPIALPRLHERKVGAQRLLEDIAPAIDHPRLFALGDDGAVGRRGEEAFDAGAGGAHALGERALRDELDLDLAAQELPLELLVLPDVGRDGFSNLPRVEEDARAELVDADVVADDGEVFCAARVLRADEILGDGAEAEAPHHDRRAVGDERRRRFGARQDLVHGSNYTHPHVNVRLKPDATNVNARFRSVPL